MKKYNKYDIIIWKNSFVCLYLYTKEIYYVLIFGRILKNINNDIYFSFNYSPQITGILNIDRLASKEIKNIMFDEFTSQCGLIFIEKVKNLYNIDLLQLDEYINYLKKEKLIKYNL